MGALDDHVRLRVLRATQLLDSPPEEAFDRLTRLAAGLVGAPVAVISLVDERRQFFKSALGLKEPWASRRETPLTHSFCKQAVMDRTPLVVEDAREHPLLRDNLAIRDLGVIAYAGFPLLVDDQPLGAFCVIDDRPRIWKAEDVRLIQDLAASAVSEIQLRLALRVATEQRALTDALVEGISDGVLAIDTGGTFLVANQAARAILVEGEVGKPAPQDSWATSYRSVRTDGSPFPSEEGPLVQAIRGTATDRLTFAMHKAGVASAIWLEASGRPVRDESGAVVAGVAVYRDVTERIRREAVQAAMVHNLPNGAIFLVDRDRRYLMADGPIIGDVRTRATAGGLVGRTVAEVAPEPYRAHALEIFDRVFGGQTVREELLRADRVLEVNAVPIRDEGGQVSHALLFLYDVTDRKREAEDLRRTRDLLARERELLSATIEQSEDAIVLIDATFHPLLANAAFARFFDLSRERLATMTQDEFLAHLAGLADEEPHAFRRRLFELRDRPTDYVLARPRRRVLRRTELKLELPLGDALVVRWRDVTAEKDLLAERDEQLRVDPLTRIANRRAAEATLVVEDERRRRSGTPLSVVMFDVDHFKRVNDVHGHATGDEVLRVIASTLSAQARATDLVARWGGEEFIAVVPGGLEGALAFAERARRAVEALSHPPLERITVSAGVAEVAAGELVGDAIARADERLYYAKREGRNQLAS